MIAVGVEKQNGNLERVDSNMSDFGKVNISFNAMYDDEMPNESNINEITKVWMHFNLNIKPTDLLVFSKFVKSLM